MYEWMGMREVNNYQGLEVVGCQAWKSSGCQAWKSSALGMVLGDGTEVRRGSTYEQGESGRGEGR
jgi:hypothetical protein